MTKTEKQTMITLLNKQKRSLTDSLRDYFVKQNDDDFDWLVHEINEVNVITSKLSK